MTSLSSDPQLSFDIKTSSETNNVATSLLANLPYKTYQQAKRALGDIEAIDFFFAKEMVLVLCVPLVNTSTNPIPVQETDVQKTTFQEIMAQETDVQKTTFQEIMAQETDVPKINDQSIKEIAVAFHLFVQLSMSLRNGHSCLGLIDIADSHFGATAAYELSVLHSTVPSFTFPTMTTLIDMLTKLALNPEDNQAVVFIGSDQSKLYLRRYYAFEQHLQQNMLSRLQTAQIYPHAEIKRCIEQLFPESKPLVPLEKSALEKSALEKSTPEHSLETIDWQKIAVANALNKNFTVIAGGPGTGKTYTVTKLLAALVLLESTLKPETEKPLQIALIAPTGKAAQRLSESINKAVVGFKGLVPDVVLANIPRNAQTIHRLLGVIPNSPNFRHDENHLLTIDVLLIDEVSMVDLALMARVFRALPSHTKVILLGDADQLPSVAAGSVLADIAPRPHGGFSANNIHYLSAVTDADIIPFTSSKQIACDHVTFLLHSRRFDGKGGIGLLANAVIAGDSKQSWKMLADSSQIEPLYLQTSALSTWLTPLIKQYYQPLFECDDVQQAFSLLADFRVLCATRQGESGVEKVNEFIVHYFQQQGVITHNSYGQQGENQQLLFHAQPIMISENNYQLGLYNGDIGILWRNIHGHLMAAFEDESHQDNSNSNDKPLKWLIPSKLPAYETVYAMTIHKTQGSEFSHVAMVLPENDNRLLSRELLYTGITRAKTKLTIASNEIVWKKAVKAAVVRDSGLRLI